MTTISGLKSATKSLACVSALSMSSSRSWDGPGRLSSGLWDIQHRARGTLEITASRCQGENVEKRGTQIGRELGDTRARNTTVGTQEQHGFGVRVEPGLELTRPVADHDHVRIVIAVPVQLGQRASRDQPGPQRLPIGESFGAQYLPRVVVPAHDREAVAQDIVEQDVLLLAGVDPGLHEQRPDRRVGSPRLRVHDGALLIAWHWLES